jgi:hypothetical protein
MSHAVEIVEDGRHGTARIAAARIRRRPRHRGLLVDEARRHELAAQARARFDEYFTVEAWMRRLLPVYEAAIASGPRRGRRDLRDPVESPGRPTG